MYIPVKHSASQCRLGNVVAHIGRSSKFLVHVVKNRTRWIIHYCKYFVYKFLTIVEKPRVKSLFRRFDISIFLNQSPGHLGSLSSCFNSKRPLQIATRYTRDSYTRHGKIFAETNRSGTSTSNVDIATLLVLGFSKVKRPKLFENETLRIKTYDKRRTSRFIEKIANENVLTLKL